MESRIAAKEGMEDVMELFGQLILDILNSCWHVILPENFWRWLELQRSGKQKAMKGILYTASLIVTLGICAGVCALIWLLLKRLGFWH